MNTEESTQETPTPEQAEAPDQQIQDRLAKLEKENSDLLHHLAEYQNRHKEMQAVLKRNSQEVELKQKYAHEKFALDLVTALDNLERAIDAAKQSGDKSPLTIGVAATLSQITDVLKRHGITPITALNQPFDPNLHQAIQSQPPGPGVEPNTVTMVVQQGFMIHDRVMRPAAVVVAQSN